MINLTTMPPAAPPQPLPSTVRVGPFDFAIKPWAHLDAHGSRRYAECNTLALEIKIDEMLPLTHPVKAIDSLLHEIGHAIWWCYGIQREDTEERIVSTTATAMTALFRDNPDLVRWISAGLGQQLMDGDGLRDGAGAPAGSAA